MRLHAHAELARLRKGCSPRAAARGGSTTLGQEEKRILPLVLQRLNENAEGLKAHKVPRFRSEVLPEPWL